MTSHGRRPRKQRLTSVSVNASKDVRPDTSKTVASSSSAVQYSLLLIMYELTGSRKRKITKCRPSKGKGKGKGRVPPTVEEGTETPSFETQTARTDTPLTPAECEAHNAQRRTAHHEEVPIPPSSEVWNIIPPPTIDFLARLGEAPTTFDPAPFLANGTLVLSTSADPPPSQFATPGETAKEAGLAYLYRYPADAPNMVLQLLLQGQDPDELQEQFREALIAHGLEGAVDTFIKDVVAGSTFTSLFGTHRSSASTRQLVRRYYPRRSVFHVVSSTSFWRTPPSPTTSTTSPHSTPLSLPPLNVRTDPVISYKERILIALLGTPALNSSAGGNDLPPLDFSLGQERSEDLEKQIESLLDDEVRLLAPCHTTQMAPAAIQALKAKVASVLRLKRGRVVRLNITKDIPLEGMQCGRYWDATVGPGPKEDRHLQPPA
ncbi:hypothetical protein B0H14DRAFT_2655491 [Mycena olivaceomarginata]|nr:hypothetical protein B0H14DRAFT_2655491 [Mycena olivaceomarginata]